jgi:aminopeptidase N
LKLSQKVAPTPKQPKKRPLHIPLAIGLVGPNGHDMGLIAEGLGELKEPVIELTRQSQTFKFKNIGSRPILSINRGFSAAVKMETDLKQSDLLFLMGHDSDPFNRWEAAQTIGTRLIIEAMKKIKAKKRIPDAEAFATALTQTLSDERMETQFRALMLNLPSEQDVASAIARNVDPQLVHLAREALRQRLGQSMRKHLMDCWTGTKPKEPYSPDPESVGKRTLRHSALSLLAAADPRQGAQMAMQHFGAARNMSDEFGALSILIHIEEPQREEALERFLARHKDDHLLVDKWFALQAQVPLEETATRVRRLFEHPLFSWKSPNRLRSLIGTFAAFNPVGFNAADGSGYKLVADAVIRLDKSNPQVAARLAASFRSYKALEGNRRRLAANALRSILRTEGLSRDSFEIVSRSLQ